MVMICGLLICCCLLLNSGWVKPDCGENPARPEPRDESGYEGSWAGMDTRLPWYTSGFE